ncbi:hypothetical protein H0H92_005544 [Tricholoma furcatifolium]|nr:hypothetical protein H0H92_005544 [Tricholoma furcatifolium]
MIANLLCPPDYLSAPPQTGYPEVRLLMPVSYDDGDFMNHRWKAILTENVATLNLHILHIPKCFLAPSLSPPAGPAGPDTADYVSNLESAIGEVTRNRAQAQIEIKVQVTSTTTKMGQ